MKSPSDCLRDLAKKHATWLSKQTGTRGLCSECGRSVPRSELIAKCHKCSGALVCVGCLDDHEIVKHSGPPN
jgi:hypothetical protein